MQQYNNFMIQ